MIETFLGHYFLNTEIKVRKSKYQKFDEFISSAAYSAIGYTVNI
jgi:hypothetical protein